jgi:hypothetical protein
MSANKKENTSDFYRVQVYLSEDQRKWLRKQSYETAIPMSKIVREIIDDFILKVEIAKKRKEEKTKKA